MTSSSLQSALEQIALSLPNRDVPIVGVLSLSASAGVTMVCRSLAFLVSSSAQPALIVDASARQPTNEVQYDAGWGFGTELPPIAVARGYGILDLAKTGVGRGGLARPNLIRDIVGKNSDRFHRVFVDIAPLDSADALFNPLAMARACDGVVIVVALGADRHRDLAAAASNLKAVGAKLLGTVANNLVLPRGDAGLFAGLRQRATGDAAPVS